MINFLPITTEVEIQRVIKLANEIWPQHYDPIVGNAQIVYMLDKFQDLCAIQSQIAEDYQYYIISHGDVDVGYLSFTTNDKELFLSKIYVLANYQGRGFGRAAINFIKQQADLKRIWLTVNKMNHKSIRFYEKQGFSISDEVVTDIGGGFVMDDYIMEV